MVAFCLEVTAPKSVSLPSGPSELHRNPIYCHWARPDRTETRFAASTAGTRTFFRTSSRAAWSSSSPCRLVALRHLSPNALSVLPLPHRSMWAPAARPARVLLERGARSSPAEEPISPRTVGVARTLARTSFASAHRAPRCWGRGPCGTRAAWPVLHARAAVAAHARGPLPTVVGYDRWPVGREVHRPAEASRRPPTSKTVHIPTTQVRPRASPK